MFRFGRLRAVVISACDTLMTYRPHYSKMALVNINEGLKEEYFLEQDQLWACSLDLIQLPIHSSELSDERSDGALLALIGEFKKILRHILNQFLDTDKTASA